MTAVATHGSYERILHYLEDDFINAARISEAAAAANLTSPWRQKPVGEVDLLRRHERFAANDDSSNHVENKLREMACTVGKHLKSGLDHVELSPLGGTSPSLGMPSGIVCALLEALKQSMEFVISLSASRIMKLFALEKLLMASIKVMGTTIVDPKLQQFSSKASIDLTTVVCQVFRHLEKVPFERNTTVSEMRIYGACFGASLRFLSKMLLLLSPTRIKATAEREQQQIHNHLTVDRTRRLEELYNALEDYQVVGSIIYQQRPHDRCKEVTADESCCVLNFFALLATCGDPKIISLLFVDEIAPLLNAILRASSPGRDCVRGYIPKATSQRGWEPDPKHENSIRAYQFLAVLLRAVTGALSTSPIDRRLKHNRFDLAQHCLTCNLHAVRGCLLHVSNAVMVDTENHLGGGHSRWKGLTIQLLRESSAILALVTELCSYDMFHQKNALMYRDISLDARNVMISVCSFLGASGMARELFRNNSDLEKGNGGTLSDGGVALGASAKQVFSPVIDVFLRSGRNNIRHEAIQFSHFVSGCCAAVSSDELKQQTEFPAVLAPSSGSSTDGNWLQQVELTESSLEHNSRCALTNRFAFSLEMEAGRCLLHAANTLWAMHPSTTSFVVFTPDEMAKIRNDISWIKVRDIVAFREDDSSYGMNCLGEVQVVDTINLSVHVRPLDDKENRLAVVVPLHRLAGVEDRTKRKGTMLLTHAPETSSDLHKSRNELSLGHLVLALRWCHEYAFEEDQQGIAVSPWLQMNARILAMLLVKEISLHRDSNQVRPVVPPDAMRLLRAQLLDLFGEVEEYSSFLQGYQNANMRETGRLSSLVVSPFWGILRSRLRDELNAAINDILAVQLEESQKVKRVHHHHSTGFLYN